MNRSEAELAPLPPVASTTIRSRMVVIGIGLFIALAVATGRAVMLQTTEASVMRREAAKNYMRTETLDDWRGDIVDRNGRLLAVSVHRWALTVDPKKVAEPTRTASLLATVTGLSEGEVLEKIDPMSVDLDEDAQVNPASSLARRLTSPMVRAMARSWGVEREYFDRRLDIVERFLQLEQLRSPAIFDLVDELAQMADDMARVLDADVDKLRFVPTRGRRFAYIAHGLDDSAVKRLAEARDSEARRCREAREVGESCKNALTAVFSRPESRRYYPKRELAAQIVGLVGRDDKGLSGMEAAMNAFLTGGLHRVSAMKDVRGHRSFLDGLPADASMVGNTVELTIDQQIQSWAELELGRACLSSGSRAGYAIVTRPRTGEVLAVANFPNYNPNTFQQWFKEQQPLKNERASLAQRRSDLAWAAGFKFSQRAFGDRAEDVRREVAQGLDQEIDAFVEFNHTHPNASRNMAFLDVYEPGSIMKVFTAAAAIEEKVVDLDTVFDLENGHWKLDDPEGNVIHDISSLEEGNLGAILKKSSNIGASKIAFLLGAHKLEEYMRRFGFGAPTRSGFPGEPKGLLRPADSWVPVELANVSFGQGMAVTGIQLAMALGAIANQGRLMQPVLVKRVLDGQGRVVKSWEPVEVRQAISPETARTTLDLMAAVIEPDGTGRRAYIPEWPVAGKTGTGQKPHLRRRGYSEEMWVNTFFGVAPVDNPELAIVILIDEPKGKRHGGGLIAAPAFRRIMERSLAYLGVPSPYATSRRYAWLAPDTLSERRAVEDAPPATDPLEALAPTVAASDGLVPVPDFRGLTMGAAARLAARAGVVVRFEGQGIATSQSTQPDELVSATEGVIVSFSSRLPQARTRSGEETPTMPGGPTVDDLGPLPAPPAGETSQPELPIEPFVRGQGGAP
jgi:cell division protein FtsI/penicillin-binding protein 2